MRKNTLFSLLFILFVLIPGLISCEKKTATAVSSDEISIEGLRQHMEYIASDETEGRMTASVGYKKAADYVVKHFKSFGLKPGWIDEKEGKTYYQPVSFLRYHTGGNNFLSVRIDGETDRVPNDQKNYAIFYPGKGSEVIPEGNPVFVGYGIHEPDLGWDDFDGLEVKDRLVIIIAGFPNNPNRGPKLPTEVRQKYRDRRTGDLQRFANVVDRGAAGMLAVPDGNIVRNWDYIMAQRKRSNLVPVENYDPSSPGESPIPTVVLHENLVNRLFKDSGFKPITHEGDYQAMEMNGVELGLSIDMRKEIVDCYNIIGIIPGTDPDLCEEYLTVGAHLDHLGRDEEFIYYGANDNASSCVLILEVAKVLAKNPLKRSVVFILFTAEEIGHFGSLHYVAHPAIPHDQVLLNINLEQIGARTRNVDGIWAIGPASEEATFLSLREQVEGIELGYDDIESQVNVISGSDTLSFYLKQHPAIILGSGGFPEHHQPSDNIDLIDFDHLHRATLVVKAYINELGNN
jgi:hypothetical protein